MSQEHADNIVAWALQTGRNPLDTAGMDSSDEDWLGQNSEWEDYIMDEWKNKKTKPKTKSKVCGINSKTGRCNKDKLPDSDQCTMSVKGNCMKKKKTKKKPLSGPKKSVSRKAKPQVQPETQPSGSDTLSLPSLSSSSSSAGRTGRSDKSLSKVESKSSSKESVVKEPKPTSRDAQFADLAPRLDEAYDRGMYVRPQRAATFKEAKRLHAEKIKSVVKDSGLKIGDIVYIGIDHPSDEHLGEGFSIVASNAGETIDARGEEEGGSYLIPEIMGPEADWPKAGRICANPAGSPLKLHDLYAGTKKYIAENNVKYKKVFDEFEKVRLGGDADVPDEWYGDPRTWGRSKAHPYPRGLHGYSHPGEFWRSDWLEKDDEEWEKVIDKYKALNLWD